MVSIDEMFGLDGNDRWQIAGVTWAQRLTSTGFRERRFSYSLDGMNYVEFHVSEGISNTGSFILFDDLADLSIFDLSQGVKSLRITLDGATSTNGNIRFDNMQLFVEGFAVEGHAVPEPATAGLLLMAGAGLLMRRRREA